MPSCPLPRAVHRGQTFKLSESSALLGRRFGQRINRGSKEGVSKHGDRPAERTGANHVHSTCYEFGHELSITLIGEEFEFKLIQNQA